MKKCEEYQEMLSTYIDEELNDQETSKLFFHLGECLECRAMMKSMLLLRSTLREAENSIHTEKEKNSFWKKRFTISYPIAAVVAMIMLVSTFIFFQKITQPPTIVEKTQTEYVYMTSLPPVYAKINSPANVKSN